MRKKNLKFTMLSLGVIAGGLLSSCAVDVDNNLPNAGNMLAKAPEMKAYSSDHYWGAPTATRGTDMNANMWNERWDCPPRPAEDLTEAELAELKALLSKGSQVHNEIVIPFENYYVQQIYKGEDQYNTLDRCYNSDCDHVNSQTELGSGHMDKLIAYNPHEEFEYWPANDYVTVEYEHVNNFNNGTNDNNPGQCGCGEVHYKTTLMTDMPTSGIDPEKQFGFHETWGTAHDYNNYIIVEYKGYYYVGFDYEAHKYDQTTHNHGEGMDIERDWNFTDWIVRITPAYHKGETPEGNPGGIIDGETPEPGTPETPEDKVCDKDDCGHDVHGDHGCKDCYDEGKYNECADLYEEWLAQQGGDSEVTDNTKEHVEINLALDKKKDDLLESHLSIHVRAATDVEVFIPVPQQYYCDADDMDIVLNHGGEFVHGGPYYAEYQIGENLVTLTVVFEEGGIRITTDGIDQDVIDYCWEHYKDGITFEVWNYFNDPESGLPYLTMEELKQYLDQATVKFLDKTPDKYVNAFKEGTEDSNGKYSESNPDGKDFHVTPVDEQAGEYDAPFEGPHFNGSDVNDIYLKK